MQSSSVLCSSNSLSPSLSLSTSQRFPPPLQNRCATTAVASSCRLPSCCWQIRQSTITPLHSTGNYNNYFRLIWLLWDGFVDGLWFDWHFIWWVYIFAFSFGFWLVLLRLSSDEITEPNQNEPLVCQWIGVFVLGFMSWRSNVTFSCCLSAT